MTRSGSVRGLLGRSLVMGCTVAVLAAGQATGAVCPPDDKTPAPGASAPAPGAGDPGAAAPGAGEPAAAEPGTTAGPAAVTASNSDLYVVRLDPDAAAPGGTTTVHAFIGNLGPDRTASPFTVVVTLPEGVTAEGPYFPENCYAFQNGHRVRCTFPAGLPKFRSATALVPVRLATTVPAPSTLTGGWVAVRGDDDRDETNNKQPFEIEVVQTTGPRPAV